MFQADAPALSIVGLSKTFLTPAVSDLNLTIRPGEFYALLGPNGAGKTTTLRMAAGLLAPDSGRISIFGVDAGANPIGAKAITAWLPDEPPLYDKLTPLEYLEFVAGLWDVAPALAQARAVDLLKTLSLYEQRNQRCEGFSRGMKQKTALAGALIHDPMLLMLDEPLTGLDAAAARQVKDILRARVAQGRSVVLTTHILDVAERLADRLGVIRRGRLIAEGALEQLRAQTGQAGASLEDVFLRLTENDSAIPASSEAS